MIHAIGDSHVIFSYSNIPGVCVHYVGAVTLKRVGNLEDEIISDRILSMNLTNKDYVVFCFGEIDVRCYVKPTIEHRKKTTLDSLLQEWTRDYTYRIASLPLSGAKVAITSVLPPTTKELADSVKWPVGGGDFERAIYTQRINEYLKRECVNRNWIYLDTYSQYVDEHGMLPPEKSDGTVHLKENTKIF